MTDPIELELGEGALGQRLDRALVSALSQRPGLESLTRSQLARAFTEGAVQVDGKPAKASMKLERPVHVRVRLPPAPDLAHAFPEAIPLAIVHEDPQLLVIDKPAGMVVHAGPGHARGTLVNAVLHHLGQRPGDAAGSDDASSLPSLPGNGPERPGIVHRLDRDTSGLLVVAKTAAALERLAQQFRTHSIDRAYLGVVLGRPDFERRRIETRHGRDPGDRRRFAPDQGERRAVTEMTRVRQLGEDAALLRFELETGRTHQIRMHARHVGHPIFADPLYGRRPKQPRLRALADGLGRHALHAAVIGFDHPDPARGRVRFESPLPPELAALVEALERPRT
ncbi:RluA family pseudouridine synthase [Pseudenhygromyxa sp. WMMC2535]|uniref:RluA family pseudouridine synthase n=1 Tax=Pseudenhygromyxa sp. WMMC2535 TaxID=2712867 RepID=UPI0015536000|nr:RluA family pseudouridine synthase [Pseudenhygromyxa sp. WMMC2535]NVB37935.1 RluA family pseudouridine synthase [Pseudenhygromyxa sp. WMMC2535]